ncbi:MAG: hypothetical protein WBF33_16480 [Candidatus Nitrosopolaris sp.]|jgi:hypothetical protein
MINNKLVLASVVAFVILAVAATTWVKQETYAENNTATQETCGPGEHVVPSNHTGVQICASDKEGSTEYTTPKHPTLNPNP